LTQYQPTPRDTKRKSDLEKIFYGFLDKNIANQNSDSLKDKKGK